MSTMPQNELDTNPHAARSGAATLPVSDAPPAEASGWEEAFSDRPLDSPGRRAVRRFVRHRLAMFGLSVLVIMALLAILADVVGQAPGPEASIRRVVVFLGCAGDKPFGHRALT